jgi:hypothetical protein
MKTNLFTVLGLVVLAITGFIINNSKVSSPSDAVKSAPLPRQTQTNNRWLDTFYIGAVDDDYDNKNSYSNLDTLGFNLWHSYISNDFSNSNRSYPKMSWSGRLNGDILMAPVGSYSSDLKKFIEPIYANGKRKLIMMRPKIDWLCYGQRSDYKCANSNHLNPELWFYGFQSPGYNSDNDDFYDTSAIGENKWVRQCLVSSTIPGYVLSRLKANTEQCHYVDPQGGNEWRCDSQCDWLIKPRIRIDSNFANNPANWSKLVCRVDVKNQKDSLIKTFEIKVRNFKVSNASRYNGNYLEEYYFAPYNDPFSQDRFGAWGNSFVYSARGNKTNENSYENHADIKVFWYGNCDMWIDYVRVDNDVASDLLSTDPNNVMHQKYDQWIDSEATQIGNNGEIMKYYLELVEFNNIPCMAYVNSKLKDYSGGRADLIQDLGNTISMHVPWENRTSVENPDFLYDQYIKKVGLTQVFAESYPMTACFSKDSSSQCFSRIPKTLPLTNGPDILAQAVNPNDYDSWLQDNINHKPYVLEEGGVDDIHCGVCGPVTCNGTSGSINVHQDVGNFRNRLQLCDSISKLADIPFILMPQLHQWFLPGEVRREPTNEELNMMANVAVSYGVKGILYYMYSSWPPNECIYGIGLTEPANIGKLRYTNYYNQTNPNKIQTIQTITDRLKNKWGPYLLSFNNADRHSYIYNDGTERSQLTAYSYISNVISFKRGTGNPACTENNIPAGMIPDCPIDRYLQVATFKKTQDDGNKYFMIVNRRCSPVNNKDSLGGKRFMRIQFRKNASDFSGYSKWEIIDLSNNSLVATLINANWSEVDLGWFMPGEGRLYKIVHASF